MWHAIPEDCNYYFYLMDVGDFQQPAVTIKVVYCCQEFLSIVQDLNDSLSALNSVGRVIISPSE